MTRLNEDHMAANDTQRVPGAAVVEGANLTPVDAQGADATPTRQTSPTATGEQNIASHKDLGVARQLSAVVTGDADPATEVAERMLASPNIRQEIIDDVHALGVVGEDDLIFMVYLTATARLLPKAITLCVNGHSSTGKSATVTTTLQLFPEDDVNHATQVTPKYLLNLDKGNEWSFTALRAVVRESADCGSMR